MGWWKKQRAGASELIEKTETISLQFGLVRVPGKPSNKPKLVYVAFYDNCMHGLSCQALLRVSQACATLLAFCGRFAARLMPHREGVNQYL